MKNTILMMTLAASLLTTGLVRPQGANAEVIPYKVEKHWFVKNSYQGAQKALEITSQADLNKIFGAAAGNASFEGIDFDKKMAIAVIMENTDKAVDIKVDSMLYNGKNILFAYTVKVGEKRTYTIRPNLLVTVDKKYMSKVIATVNH